MKRRVAWWPVIALVSIAMALFAGEQRLTLSPTGHQTTQVAIVLLVFGLITMWLKLQDPAFQQEELERYRMTFYAPDGPPAEILEDSAFPEVAAELEKNRTPAPPPEALVETTADRLEVSLRHSLN